MLFIDYDKTYVFSRSKDGTPRPDNHKGFSPSYPHPLVEPFASRKARVQNGSLRAEAFYGRTYDLMGKPYFGNKVDDGLAFRDYLFGGL